MKVLLTGGGTGGHITPLLAVAHELKLQQPTVRIVYVGERHGKFGHLTEGQKVIDEIYTVQAGKFRRYHGQSWLRRLFDVRTNLLNIRDVFYFLVGTIQSWRLLGRVKPDIIFLKGGFVGVPIGLAAAMRRIPFVTHDSDALPGLANRLVSRWAKMHATALAAEHYAYPKDKVLHVGVLVDRAYKPVTTDMQNEYKLRLSLRPDAPLLLVTGGSSGAESINEAVRHSIATLLQNHSTLQIIHQTGKGKTGVYGGFTHERLKVLEFMNPMVDYMGAADIVVTRASANTLAELGTMGKACIVVPGAHLADGHQLKNAQRLLDQQAAIVIEEEKLYDPQHGLFSAITALLIDPKKCHQLAAALQQQTIPNAAERLAKLLLEQAK